MTATDGRPRGPALQVRTARSRRRLRGRGAAAGGLLRRRHRPVRRRWTSSPGDIDVALLPIAGWGPKLGPGHLDPRSAAEAAALHPPRRRDPDPLGHADPPRHVGRRADEFLASPPRRFAAQLAELAPGGRGGGAGAGRVLGVAALRSSFGPESPALTSMRRDHPPGLDQPHRRSCRARARAGRSALGSRGRRPRAGRRPGSRPGRRARWSR